MKKTLARIQFKKHFGQANHHLITSLVALHTLEKSSVIQAPGVLRTAWTPKDKNASVMRSRIFVLQSFLGWAVDSIDMYLGLLNRKPNYLQDISLSSKLDGAGRSVLKKVTIYSDHYKINEITHALIDVLITWRNNVFHELADNKLRPDSRKTLVNKASDIAETYRGLEVSGLAEKAEKGDSLTFKETASLINAAHHFVQELDEKILAVIDPMKFCKEAIQDALDEKDQATGFAAKYFGLTTEQRFRFLRNWLMNEYGYAEPTETILDECSQMKRNTSAV
ncbi:hypothetical protein J5J83_12325 [Azoarcus sp. L1K30]|uniref:hypothetical protein n=1 Tax=Azoarcus sp. L1K30 TaxID=2820277 RepID=UPI001B820B4C|nr:hypothetical protein [Azoarcus sp. L1K30]MBR0566901.1 hypothetical protein [Azoarcus sp. L1K30]